MKRQAIKFLESWVRAPSRVPLLIRGARQVGKTWLVREFAKSFESFCEVNFESDTEFHRPFRDLFGKPKELVSAVLLLSGVKILPGKTLLFLDEIQGCKEALQSLRYFKEGLPELHVIAAGSLLEFAIKELSFPVGRLDFFHLFPMNFEEYLAASGREDLVGAISGCDESQPLSSAVHDLLLDQVAIYCFAGGMPEVVKSYIETRDFSEVQRLQQRLIGTYREDFYKYASRSNIEYLRKLFDDIPKFLGQKFKYSRLDPEARSRELSSALGLLLEAGLAYKTCHTSANGLPLSAQVKETRFKVFCLDVGLAQRALGLAPSRLFVEDRHLLANRGAIAEQFVAQEIVSATKENEAPRLFYWHREAKSSTSEVDFVVEHGSRVLPIEVKSGEGGKTKSLRLFMKEKAAFVKDAIKVSSENFHRRDGILTMPFYALPKLFR